LSYENVSRAKHSSTTTFVLELVGLHYSYSKNFIINATLLSVTQF